MANHTFKTSVLISTPEGAEHEIEAAIKYEFYRYQPAYTPPGEYAPIDPPEPASAEIHDVQLSENGHPLACPEWLFEMLCCDDGMQAALIAEQEGE